MTLAVNGAAEPRLNPLFRDFMGVNGHTIQFRPKLYLPVATWARDYSAASVVVFPQLRRTWAPTPTVGSLNTPDAG